MSKSHERRINLDTNNAFLGFDKLFTDVFNHKTGTNNYPPHNIYRTSHEDVHSDMVIEIALAGIGKKDIDITVSSQDTLRVVYQGEGNGPSRDYVHKGIAKRKFELEWRMNKDLEVANARFDNGMLYIDIKNLTGTNASSQKIDIN